MAKAQRDTERELIEACQRGDSEAFELIYNNLSDKMYAVCLRYTKHNDDAKDVLQDAFIRIYKNLKQFRFSGSFEGWCRRIVVNTAIERIRKNGRLAEDSLELAPETSVKAESFEQLKYDDLMTLIRTLPDGYRTVFNMYVIEGYSHKEIAEELQVSESTSKTQLYKARLTLQQKLGNQR
ncbi:MAG: RNA polymerase sigma factor (sigma-70 family) [Bacteroidia bacterium]|jgi:RNA polymerase sigma factor (sigma-70 family)